MFSNQLTATSNEIFNLNYKLQIAQDLRGSKKLIREILRDLKFQTRCKEYLQKQIATFTSPVETKVETLNLNLIFANV